MTDEERMAMIKELAENVTRQVIDGLVTACRNCPNCVFWQEANETCRNTINCPQGPQRPPAKVIAWGCNLFVPELTL